MGKLSTVELHRIREEFRSDWEIGLITVEVNVQTMKALPRLVEKYPLKAGDAIHLVHCILAERQAQGPRQRRSNRKLGRIWRS